MIMQLHDVIYPNQAELTSIKNIVKVTEDSLKIISDTMKGETEAELKDKGKFVGYWDPFSFKFKYEMLSCGVSRGYHRWLWLIK